MARIVKGPYLQWPTQDAVTVMWETSEPCSGAVSYCTAERVASGLNGRYRSLAKTTRSVPTAAADTVQAVTLTGLLPETTYHYTIAITDSAGDSLHTAENPLKTAVRPGTPFSFAVTSETGGYGDDAINARLFAQMGAYRPDFLLMVGDSVARGSRYEDWGRHFFGPGQALLRHTPFYLCPGNHEEDADWYYRFVAYPAPQNYYAFTYGNALFVALDSTRESECRPGGTQYRFARDALQAEAAWKFVFFHYPPYVSGDYQVDAMQALCPLFDATGVDLVFNSHTIVYERSHPLRAGHVNHQGGVRYIVAGGAGMKPEWFHHKRAWHTAQAVAVPHFVQVVVSGPALELHAIDIDGRHFDQLSLWR